MLEQDLDLAKLLKRFTYLGFSMLCDLYTNMSNLFVDLEAHLDVDPCAVEQYRIYLMKIWVGVHDETDMLTYPPRFRPTWWSSRIATIETEMRTTCPVEAWHDAFDRRIRSKGRPGVIFKCF